MTIFAFRFILLRVPDVCASPRAGPEDGTAWPTVRTQPGASPRSVPVVDSSRRSFVRVSELLGIVLSGGKDANGAALRTWRTWPLLRTERSDATGSFCLFSSRNPHEEPFVNAIRSCSLGFEASRTETVTDRLRANGGSAVEHVCASVPSLAASHRRSTPGLVVGRPR